MLSVIIHTAMIYCFGQRVTITKAYNETDAYNTGF
jgi:hypothetical protein